MSPSPGPVPVLGALVRRTLAVVWVNVNIPHRRAGKSINTKPRPRTRVRVRIARSLAIDAKERTISLRSTERTALTEQRAWEKRCSIRASKASVPRVRISEMKWNCESVAAAGCSSCRLGSAIFRRRELTVVDRFFATVAATVGDCPRRQAWPGTVNDSQSMGLPVVMGDRDGSYCTISEWTKVVTDHRAGHCALPTNLPSCEV